MLVLQRICVHILCTLIFFAGRVGCIGLHYFKSHSAKVYIGLYRDVWIAAIASSTTSLATRTAAICVRFQGRRVRHNADYVPYAKIRFDLRQRVASLTLNCNGDFAIRAYRRRRVLSRSNSQLPVILQTFGFGFGF